MASGKSSLLLTVILTSLLIAGEGLSQDKLSVENKTPMATLDAESKTTLVSQPTNTLGRVVCNQQTFFDAVQQTSPRAAFEMMHPELTRLIDEPVFVAWTRALKTTLGPVKQIEEEESNTSSNNEITQSVAKIAFENGEAKSTIKTLNGQMVSFLVESDQMENWFEGPASSQLYQEQGRAFIRLFLHQEVNAAFNMCHEALQKKVPQPKLAEMMNKVTNLLGNCKFVKFVEQSIDFSKDSQKISLLFAVECENATASCKITFQFIGMKAHLVAFSFK